MRLIFPAILFSLTAFAASALDIQTYANQYSSSVRAWQKESERRELLACGPNGDAFARAGKLTKLQKRISDSEKFVNALASGLQGVLYAPMSAAGVDACSLAFNRMIDGLEKRSTAIERSKALVEARKRDLEKEREEFRIHFADQSTQQSLACARYPEIVERMKQEYEQLNRSLSEMSEYLEVNRQAFGDSIEENKLAKANCGAAR